MKNMSAAAWWEFVRFFGKAEAPFERLLLGGASGEALARGRSAFPGHTLYHFQGSPFALRVRWEMARLKTAIPTKDILEDAQAHAELVQQGRKDQVPCLRIDVAGGATRWLYESADIVEYLRKSLLNS